MPRVHWKLWDVLCNVDQVEHQAEADGVPSRGGRADVAARPAQRTRRERAKQGRDLATTPKDLVGSWWLRKNLPSSPD